MLIKKNSDKLQYFETEKNTESIWKDIFRRHDIASRSSHLVVVFCENRVTEISKVLLKFLTNPLKIFPNEAFIFYKITDFL